jgi:hypothetical protein
MGERKDAMLQILMAMLPTSQVKTLFTFEWCLNLSLKFIQVIDKNLLIWFLKYRLTSTLQVYRVVFTGEACFRCLIPHAKPFPALGLQPFAPCMIQTFNSVCICYHVLSAILMSELAEKREETAMFWFMKSNSTIGSFTLNFVCKSFRSHCVVHIIYWRKHKQVMNFSCLTKL